MVMSVAKARVLPMRSRRVRRPLAHDGVVARVPVVHVAEADRRSHPIYMRVREARGKGNVLGSDGPHLSTISEGRGGGRRIAQRLESVARCLRCAD